jgi:hypothetical protein
MKMAMDFKSIKNFFFKEKPLKIVQKNVNVDAIIQRIFLERFTSTTYENSPSNIRAIIRPYPTNPPLRESNYEINNYADEVGGVYQIDEFEIIPYNHWKKDNEWIVLVLSMELPQHGSFIPVQAYTAREAAQIALNKYQNWRTDYE